MNEEQLEKLGRIFFRSCAEHAPVWKRIGIRPDGPQDLRQTDEYRKWSRQTNILGQRVSPYESSREAIRSAELYLNKMGYHTTSIRSPTRTAFSVRVANAGAVRLCVRIPKEIAEQILILGFVPRNSVK